MVDLSKYIRLKAHMQTGDLLQWLTNSVIGALIRWKTDSSVNHSSLILRLPEYEGKEERRYTTEALGSGTVLSLLSRRLREFDGNVWWYPLDDKWNSKRQAIGEKALELIWIPYDYGSLFKQLFGRVSSDARHLFCSEYCYLSYLHGIGDQIKLEMAPTPADMPGLGIFKSPVKIL